jgi:TIR domain
VKLGSYEFYNPLLPARVFISHSWHDNEVADYLNRSLKEHFTIYYDRSAQKSKGVEPSMLFGEDLVPRKEIRESDVFLFVASESSMQETSRAYKELEVALNLPPVHAPYFAIVAVEDYRIPEHFNTSLYFRFHRKSKARDVAHILQHIEAKLIRSGGLYKPSYVGDSELTLVGGKEPGVVLDNLSSKYNKGLYTLNAVFPAAEQAELLGRMSAMDPLERDRIIEKLIGIFVGEHSNPALTIARQNSIVLAAKLAPGEEGIRLEVERRAPDFPTPFLYRGFQVALGLLGSKGTVIEYAKALEQETAPEWDVQRFINRRFHIDYYGGVEPALRTLRRRIRQLDPDYILALDVYTLGELSNRIADLDLLHDLNSTLIAREVPRVVIRGAIRRIKGRQVVRV